MSRLYIEELIQRMIIKEEVRSSDESISWKAYREAEIINDVSLFPILKELILMNLKSKDKKYRNAAYFIMGNLIKYVPDIELIVFYLKQLEIETDKYILSAMLDRISNFAIPTYIPVKIIASLSFHEKWLIRHSAIKALGSSATLESKKTLYYYIKQEDEKAYKYEIIYANASLGKIGSMEDVSIIEQHLKSKIRDIKGSAEFAIQSIRERNGTYDLIV